MNRLVTVAAAQVFVQSLVISCSLASGFSPAGRTAPSRSPGCRNRIGPRLIRRWPFWIGCSSIPWLRPSTVRMDRSLGFVDGVLQLLTAWPLTTTTQVPQVELSQPRLVPVRSSTSRITSIRVISGSTSTVSGFHSS